MIPVFVVVVWHFLSTYRFLLFVESRPGSVSHHIVVINVLFYVSSQQGDMGQQQQQQHQKYHRYQLIPVHFSVSGLPGLASIFQAWMYCGLLLNCGPHHLEPHGQLCTTDSYKTQTHGKVLLKSFLFFKVSFKVLFE